MVLRWSFFSDTTSVELGVLNGVNQHTGTPHPETAWTAQSEVQTFIYRVSHDLQAPVRAVNNLARWIAEECEVLPQSSDLKDYLRLLQETAVTMNGIIEGLLDLSRLPRLLIESGDLPVKETLHEILSGLTIPDGMAVTLSGEPGCRVTMPRPALDRLLGCLLHNCIQHAGNTAVTIQFQRVSGEFHLMVTDTGPGIPENESDRVFEPFQKGSCAADSAGPGLGLTIGRRIAELLGGSLVLQDPSAGCCTFVLRLPQADGEDDL